MTTILISLFFSIGFFVESIVGFGGGLIAYPALGFFLDIKEIVLVALYIGTCSSAYIAFGGRSHIDKKIIIGSFPICLFGTFFGVAIFSHATSHSLLKGLGAFLILMAIKMIFFDNYKFPKIFRNFLLFFSGIIQGIFGLGGPLVVIAIKDDFKNKSSLRATMGVFFVSMNIFRFIQLGFNHQFKSGFFAEVWWTIIPVFVAIYLGHKVHAKISEKTFKKIISVMITLAGIEFLLR